MTVFLTFLYALLIPYIALELLVLVGTFRAKRRPRSDKTPSVSVIIPAHNEEEDLPATLYSLWHQEYEGDVEFVIVNDRSKDRTPEIVEEFMAKDSRFRLLNISQASKRFAPKVNAVDYGIRHSTGDIIFASDSDCQYHPRWVADMVSHFEDDVAMVVGYVETRYKRRNFVEKFEATDWFSLMLVSRALTHFGWKFASSANNQAYRRSAFEQIGGFGVNRRAPSGDEDLLTQSMAKLPNMRIVFASTPESRVRTQPMSDLKAFLKQRTRWSSRYKYMLHYHPTFLASIFCLAAQSVVLSIAILLSLVVPAMAPWVFGLWGAKLAVEIFTMYIGTRQLDRKDLWGLNTLRWALLHPFFIAYTVIMAFYRTGEWKAGARSYRRRFYKRRVREIRRKLQADFHF